MKLFLSLLFLLFLGLKLSHNIDWSWWWICSPMIALTILYILAGSYEVKLNIEREKQRKSRPTKWQQRVDEIRKRNDQCVNDTKK